MGKLTTFAIQFSTQPAVFFPGHPVTGVVHVSLKEAMKMRHLRLKFEGKAHVSTSVYEMLLLRIYSIHTHTPPGLLLLLC